MWLNPRNVTLDISPPVKLSTLPFGSICGFSDEWTQRTSTWTRAMRALVLPSASSDEFHDDLLRDAFRKTLVHLLASTCRRCRDGTLQ